MRAIDLTERVTAARPAPTTTRAPADADASMPTADAGATRDEAATTDPFCANAPRILGYPTGARVMRCVAANPALGLYYVILVGPEVPEGWLRRVAVVRDGALVAGRGMDAMAAFYRAIRVYQQRVLTVRDAMGVRARRHAPPCQAARTVVISSP